MLEDYAHRMGKMDGREDAENNKRSRPRPNMGFAFISNAYLVTYFDSYKFEYQAVNQDKAYLRRQKLANDQRIKEKQEREIQKKKEKLLKTKSLAKKQDGPDHSR